MTATEPTTEETLWLTIGDRPDDQLPRLVAADWYQERAEMVGCNRCSGDGTEWHPLPYNRDEPDRKYERLPCPTCSGTCYVPDRNGRMAAALRATVLFVPHHGADLWWFHCREDGYKHWPDSCRLPAELTDAAGGVFSAKMAIRRLCEVWCKVTYGEVPA